MAWLKTLKSCQLGLPLCHPNDPLLDLIKVVPVIPTAAFRTALSELHTQWFNITKREITIFLAEKNSGTPVSIC